MAQIFKLIKGEIQFETDKIIISDDAKKQRLLLLWGSGMAALYGIFSFLKYLKTGDQFLLWSGIVIGISHLIIFIIFLTRTAQKEIYLDEVKSIKSGQKFGNKYLDIRLKNNRLRRVIRVDDLEELDNYVREYYRLKF